VVYLRGVGLVKIDGLYYEPIIGGLRSGLFCLSLGLSNDGPDFTATELIGKIHQNSAALNPKVRILFIRDHGTENDPREVNEFIDSIKDSFQLVADLSGERKPAWSSLAVCRRVHIENDPWLMYKADEIYYHPRDGLVEPEIGPANNEALRYLYMEYKLNTESVTSFTVSARRPWFVLSRPHFVHKLRLL
jgi:hypothetical protein